MEENIDTVLTNLLLEYGRDANQAQPIIKILNENWYFKLKDIKDLDAQTWKDMGLPVNLFNLLNKRVKESVAAVDKPTQTLNENKSVTLSQNQQTQGKGPIEQKSFEKAVDKIKNEKEQFNAYKQMVSDNNINNNQQKLDTEKKIPKQMIEEENIDEIRIYVNKFLDNIVNEIRDSTVYIPIMKNLYTIIENIVKNSSEPKFRKIKAFGGFIEKSVAANEAVMKFFLWIPFVLSEENGTFYYIFKGTYEDLHKIYKYYNDYLLNKKIVKLNFDAFSTHFTSIGSNAELIKSKSEVTDFDDMIRKEQARRSAIIKGSTKTERKPKIFIIDNKNMGALINHLNEDDEKNSYNREEEDSRRSALNFLKENKEKEKFKLRLRTEYEKLISTKVYEYATIRIKFPNQILVQAKFAMMETVGDIYNFIREILINPNEDFYIFTTPPVKKYDKLNVTIHGEKLAPSTTMYIGFPNIDTKNENIQYISQEAFTKYYTDFHS